MSAFHRIAPKLAKLLLRLASDHNGEVVATAGAIGRTLAGAGADWHDLAGALDRPAARAEPSCGSACRSDLDGLRSDLARVQQLLRAPELLPAKEIEFLRSIRRRLSGGRPLTSPQSEWLADIEARACREFA